MVPRSRFAVSACPGCAVFRDGSPTSTARKQSASSSHQAWHPLSSLARLSLADAPQRIDNSHGLCVSTAHAGRREPPFGDVPRSPVLRLQGLITLLTPCSLAHPRRTCFRPAALLRFAAKRRPVAIAPAFPPAVARVPFRSLVPRDHRDRAAPSASNFRTHSSRLAAASRLRVFSPPPTQPLRAFPLQGDSESALRATVRTLLPHAWAIRKKPQPGVSKFRLAPLLATSARRLLAGAHGIPLGVLHQHRPRHLILRRRSLCVHRSECRALPPTNLPASRRPHDLLTLSRPA